MRKVSLCLVVFIFFCSSTSALTATRTAASCSLADVQAAVNGSVDGDTVLIPNGSATWTGGIATTKQIMIRAQNYVATPNGNVARNVVITNNSPSPLFALTSGNNFHCGVAGIKFVEGTQQTNFVRIQGSGSKVPLINDCWFDIDERFGNQPDVAPFACLSLGGVIWNCRFDTPGLDFQGYPGSHGSTIYIHSPRAWNTASTMGALDTNGNVNTYFENCTFFNCGQCPDTDDNGRVVFRHCLFDGTTGITHGYTSTWGGRHFEYYDSTFSVTTPERNCSRYFWVRAGTGIFTDCVVNNSVTPNVFGNCTLLDIGDNTAPFGAYPIARQPGWGHNGTSNVSDPIYLWNLTGSRAYTWGHNTQAGNWDQYVLLNRDIFVNSGAKPGYAKFTYPHPLRSGTTPPPPGDTTPPTVAMTAPAGGATVSGTVTVSANASDNVGVTSVQFRLDGANLGAADMASPFSISWNSATATNGSHTLSAVVRDAAGNTTISASVSVTVSNTSGPAPLPTGNNGIAAQYPGDTNIQSNAAVIFADGFEGYTTANDLWSNWNNVFQVSNTRIATEAGNYFGGNKALEFKLPQGGTEVANAVQRNLNPAEDLVFIRYYTKFDPTFDITGSGHNGASLQAKYDGPGVPANGTNKFLVMTENSRESTSVTSPGPTHIYIYHPEQRDIWGDHWYPDGTISPFTSTPGNFGPYFVPRPNTTPQLGRWYCYELMVKANTPGQRDGRIAIWIDGTLVADWLNVRLRDVSTLKMDKFDLGLHAHNRSHDIKKWYDNVVVARSYIGPVVTSPPPPGLPTVTVSATDAAAGEPSNPGVFTITRTGATTAALAVNFAVGGTASSADYAALGTSVTIPAGAASATRTVTPVDDTTPESNETVTLTIAGSAAYLVGTPSSATVTIADNDAAPPPPLPTVTIAATDAAAGEPSNPGLFTFTRTGATTAALTVNFSVGGTATNVSDYNTLGTSVTIPAGAASATRTVTPVDNTVVEPNETVIVTLSSNAAYTVGSPSSATVTIADNDTPPNTPPVITSAASATPNPALVGQNIAFSVAASDENGDALAYSWTFGDGASATGSSVTHAYAAAGTFTAKATASDGHGGAISSSVTVTVAAAGGIVVDNKHSNTSRTGGWGISAGLKPWAGQSLFSNSGGTFRWIPAVPAAGSYQVYAWWTYHSNRSTNVPYRIAHAAGVATVGVNQRLSTLGGKWNLLGTFSFNAGSGGFVEVSSANGQACADAIQLLPVGPGALLELSEGAGASAGELTIDALNVSVEITKESGAVRLKTRLELPGDFNPGGATAAIDISGAIASFTLDKRGRAKGANGSISLKRSKSGWQLSASLKSLTWPNQWTETGVEDWKTHSGKVAMPVVITVGDAIFSGERDVTCKGNGRKSTMK